MYEDFAIQYELFKYDIELIFVFPLSLIFDAVMLWLELSTRFKLNFISRKWLFSQ